MAVLPGNYIARDTLGNGTSPKGARLALGGLLAGNGASPLDVRTGVLADNGGSVVTGGTGMWYIVRAARFVTAISVANGPTVLANDAAATVTTTAAPGSNSRIDVIWVRQHMVAGDGGTDTDTIGQIGVTQGSIAASPAVPAIPVGALALAQAIVTAGTTATNTLTFTQVHPWTVANGGIIPDRLGGGTVFDGTSWVPISMGDTGWVSVPLFGAAFTAVSGYPLEARREGKRVRVRGMANWASGTLAVTTICTLPVGFRPGAASLLETTLGTGTSCVGQPVAFIDGKIAFPSVSYYTGTPAAGMLIKISGTIFTD